MKKIIFVAIAALMSLAATADNEWLHIYRTDKNFNTFPVEDIQSVTYQGTGNGYNNMVVTGTDNKTTTIDMSKVDRCEIGTNVPEIHINLTDYPTWTELLDKGTYRNATVIVKGMGTVPDMEETVTTIKGRGNSTWNMDKKPYRFKFPSKVALCGLKKAKSFCLIANFIDNTSMRNSLALKMGQLLSCKFTNHSIHVKVYLNGVFKGLYMLTEQITIGGTSVDIDENTGILWEIDTNYDEDFKFYSSHYNLPVMVKQPDFNEIATALGTSAYDLFNNWRTDFDNVITAIYNGASVSDYFDIDDLVNYGIVYAVTANHEFCHPKSTYIHKADMNDKYHMGPIWDFDWAYTYGGNYQEGAGIPTAVLFYDTSAGSNFFKKVYQDPEVRTRYAERWAEFYSEIWPQVMEYFDELADQIEPAALENGQVWRPTSKSEGTQNFRANVETLRTWLNTRINFLNTHTNYGLY